MTVLQDRRVLVVGASSGIGRGIAEALLSEGAAVAIAARRSERLAEIAGAFPTRAIPLACDVTDPDSCTSVVAASVEALGGLDVLVYAAGTTAFVDAHEASAEDWRHTIDTNLIGFGLVAGAAIPALVRSSGHLIYLSSISARSNTPWRGIGLYTASKVGAESLLASFRREVPQVAFTTLVVGSTASEFGSGQDITHLATDWFEKENISADALEPQDHADAIKTILSSPMRTLYSEVVLEPRRLSVGVTADEFLALGDEART
jgi:NADP-dependent 3-hydroxy acid dehydrogenase YdfG